MTDELDRFKTDINLSEYAAGQGYCLDKRHSSRNSVVMRHENGDKIIIARGTDSHYIYFSVTDHSDNGSIIDFVQNRQGMNLGQVRRELRPWIGASATRLRIQPALYVKTIIPTSKDRQQVITRWNRMQPLSSHIYLAARGLADGLADRRFAGRLRCDERGNAAFAHFDAEGLCGYELKNANFTGFAPGVIKGVWTSRARLVDDRLVIAESAIDAMSYHLLHGGATTRYLSIGGSMNDMQPGLVVRAVQLLPHGATVVLATDNDPAGTHLADQLRHIVSIQADRADIVIQEHRPEKRGQDWNDVLLQKQQQALDFGEIS